MANLVCLSVPCAAKADKSAKIYKYRNRSGRLVFTNDPSLIPKKFQKTKKSVDLSHVSLNLELADDIEQTAATEIKQLLKSNSCLKVLKRADRNWWQTAWEEDGHLILIGGGLLVLLITAPFVGRIVGFSRWGKVVMLVFPLMLMIAVITTAMVKTGRAMHAATSAADPCQIEHYRNPVTTPQAEQYRNNLIQKLREQVVGAHTAHSKQLDQLQQLK